MSLPVWTSHLTLLKGHVCPLALQHALSPVPLNHTRRFSVCWIFHEAPHEHCTPAMPLGLRRKKRFRHCKFLFLESLKWFLCCAGSIRRLRHLCSTVFFCYFSIWLVWGEITTTSPLSHIDFTSRTTCSLFPALAPRFTSAESCKHRAPSLSCTHFFQGAWSRRGWTVPLHMGRVVLECKRQKNDILH